MTSHRTTLVPPPALDDDGRLVVRLQGHDDAAAVDLLQELHRPRDRPRLERRDGWWEGRLDVHQVDRAEYRFRVHHRHGGDEVRTDPHNPHVVANPFGARSVWQRPGYGAPHWLALAPDRHGTRGTGRVHAAALGRDVTATTWHHPDLAADEPAFVLVVHDGTGYDREARLVHLLDLLVDHPGVPRLRALLLDARHRNGTYSADDAYADALVTQVVPGMVPLDDRPRLVGVGASLGGLAHLHAAQRHHGRYAGLFLQSGSYFGADTDRVESGFAWFDRITSFTAGLADHGPTGPPVPTVLTCGLVEENLANNRATADTLARAGWPVRFVGHRDAHNMTSWRDTLHPHLRDLLRYVASHD